jgi:hypothetical protein
MSQQGPANAEAVYSALATIIGKTPGLTFGCSRRPLPINQVMSGGNTPIAFLIQKEEDPRRGERTMIAYAWFAKVIIEVIVGSSVDPSSTATTAGTVASVPATVLNNIVTAIKNQIPPSLPVGPVASAPSGMQRNNLGITGVQWVSIDGIIEFDAGYLAPNSAAWIPLLVVFG